MAKRRVKVPRWNPLRVTNATHVYINNPDKVLDEDSIELLLESGERLVME